MNEIKQDSQNYEALIMVVDDNAEFLNGIELTLEMEGFKTWMVTNGQQALDELKAAALEQDRSDGAPNRLPDLILADIMMPVMDGYEFYDQVRRNPYTNHIPFIFLTAKSEDVDVRQGKEMGADDYLPKLASTEDILASVRGKLSRVRQRRTVLAQFLDEPGKPRMGGVIIAIIVIAALIALAFYLGALLPLP